eukprot:666359-Pelagomonas_calceolata.AAC.1
MLSVLLERQCKLGWLRLGPGPPARRPLWQGGHSWASSAGRLMSSMQLNVYLGVVVNVLAGCLAGEVAREEEVAVCSVCRVGRTASAIICSGCSVHITNHEGSAIAMCVLKS